MISRLALVGFFISGNLVLGFHTMRYKSFFTPLTGPAPVDQYFDQDLDHFDAQNNGTWKQRYFVNENLWKKGNNKGPVFLMIEGESEASPQWAVSGHHYDMAIQHNALIFVVEHRYYGLSTPFGTYSNKNLQFLSSQQALADLAVLMEFLKDKYGFSFTQNKVITFGGSYPGNLAAWARIKYPHLFYAAVASSAPVLAKLDYFEYNQVVAKSYANKLVGGSQECADKISSFFTEMNKVFTSGSPAEVDALYKKYGACKISNGGKGPSGLDKAYFVMALSNEYMSTVQYNSGSAIADQCEKTLRETEGEPISGCQDVSYKALVKSLSEDESSTSDNSRQWIYQTCTQFGYFQTCETNENGKCLFAPQMNLEYYTSLCRDVFGFASHDVSKRIQFSNDYYGGNYTQGSRILFVNGEIDPWHALSVQKDLQDDQTSILIPDGSHCQNMYASSSEDSEFMKKAKLKIETKVAEWIRNPTFVIE